MVKLDGITLSPSTTLMGDFDRQTTELEYGKRQLQKMELPLLRALKLIIYESFLIIQECFWLQTVFDSACG